MYASLLLGHGSHKHVTNSLLRFYYWKPVLFLACAGTEMWYVALYTLAHTEGPVVSGVGVPFVRLVFLVCTPVCAFKQLCNLVQGYVACDALVQHDVASRKAS
jgi:CDP-diacylglycerol--inositol 3-phosphatidyltransferase